MAKTKDATKLIDAMVAHDQELRQLIADEAIHSAVARMVYDARTRAGLTQRALAELVGAKLSFIVRLEDGDYEGDSLSMLNRIAKALNRRLMLRMTPVRGRR